MRLREPPAPLPTQNQTPSPPSTPGSDDSRSSLAARNVGRNAERNAENLEDATLGQRLRLQNTGFNLNNLPPRQVISRCLVSFFRGYGLLYFFLPDVHTMSLYRAAYSPDQDELTHMNNAEFSLLLLTAAVGALYAEDSDAPVKGIREELFAVGKYHLDVAVGFIKGASGADADADGSDDDVDRKNSGTRRKKDEETDILKITALATAALYMIFEKEILARKYIGMNNYIRLHFDYIVKITASLA